MGRIAAETLLSHIEGTAVSNGDIAVEPELVIRKSTGVAPAQVKTAAK
jgi:DNA-binding LacI/PurR family transcriptional regulator